jgi:hypothetical protein
MGVLIVVVVVVVSVMVLTEPVYTVLVTINVVCAGHVSDFECGQLDDGVQGGRVGVYHLADVLPPPPSPRSRFLTPATKRPNNVTKSKNFIFRFAALAERNTEGQK